MTRRLNVAHLLASNFFGGPEKQLVEHGRRLGAQIVPHIISFAEHGKLNQLLVKAREAGISGKEVASKWPFDPRTIREITAIIRQEKIDLICVHGYKANVVGRIASWCARVPLIAISRGWTGEDSKVRCYEWLDRVFLRFADHIVAVSSGQRDKIIRLGISGERISVIHNAINLADTLPAPVALLRRQLCLPDNAVIVASAGRLSPEKNYAAMIEVAHEVTSQDSSAYFVIFGEGFLRPELEAKIQAAGLTGRFFLPGFRNDLQAVLHEIDIFMLPSFTEGLPNVILEAFAARKPVVASRVGGTPEVVQEGVSGFLTRPDEISMMVRHVLALTGDPALRSNMGKAGYRYAEEVFGFAQQTQSYQKLFRQIIK